MTLVIDDEPGWADVLCAELTTFTGTPEDFFAQIAQSPFTEYGIVTVEARNPGIEIALTTGGWSENEQVIAALRTTVANLLWWQTIQRGGRYVYRVPAGQWTQVWDLGTPGRPAEFMVGA